MFATPPTPSTALSHMYRCIYVLICMYVYIYIYIHTYMHTICSICNVCMYVCVRACVRACVHACMHACMYVCMLAPLRPGHHPVSPDPSPSAAYRASLSVCEVARQSKKYVFVYMYIHICMYIHMCIYIYIYTYMFVLLYNETRRNTTSCDSVCGDGPAGRETPPPRSHI